MRLLALLLCAVGLVAQGGRAVDAASARRGSLGAVNRRANANGRPGLVSHRSALRRLQDPIWQEPEDEGEDETEEPESVEESVEDLVDKVEEIVDALGESNEAPSIDIDELMEDVAEVMEEAQPEESPEAPWEDAPGQQGEPGQSERFTTTPPPGDEPGESTPTTVVGATEPAEEVAVPAAGETTEPAETEESTDPTSAETSEDETTEAPDDVGGSGATDAPGEDATTTHHHHHHTTTTNEESATEDTSSGVNEGADDGGEGEEDEGEPLIASPAPTPKPIDSWYEPEKESQGKAPTNEPTSDDPWGGEPEETDDPWGEEAETEEWGWAPEGPTNPPTPRPTYQYQPPDEGEDPIEEEKEADKEGFTDDGVFYHGLGGTVGEYLDGVESPQELAQDKNVEVIAGILVGVFLVLLLVTAHFVMNHPDGLCAGCCRLTLKVICCFTRTLCLPCRAICCKGSEQSHSRRSHTPMRTPFPTDLELA